MRKDTCVAHSTGGVAVSTWRTVFPCLFPTSISEEILIVSKWNKYKDDWMGYILSNPFCISFLLEQ